MKDEKLFILPVLTRCNLQVYMYTEYKQTLTSLSYSVVTERGMWFEVKRWFMTY